ncbi:hypothetical protein DDR33_24070 [Pararcticibacter amylolyticus]|uniref:Uncharacterized protein n=1 Tax=Pararcticibacter amylolyticus TaxID=2173175 RepID=A0A2U2P9N8_9SPHI|nr:hypothetical protein DDR33_24070 [Pararcticibacter amylolyticus]
MCGAFYFNERTRKRPAFFVGDFSFDGMACLRVGADDGHQRKEDDHQDVKTEQVLTGKFFGLWLFHWGGSFRRMFELFRFVLKKGQKDSLYSDFEHFLIND